MGRDIAVPMLNLSARRCWLSAPFLGRFTRENDAVPIAHDSMWAPGHVRKGVEKIKSLAPPGFQPQAFQPIANFYVGHLENKERLRIQPAQLFNFS